MSKKKARILYILHNFPQISQTYIKNEIEALKNNFEIFVIANNKPNLAYKTNIPYKIIKNEHKIIEHINSFKPDILHTHWMHQAPLVGRISKKTGIPFTVRAHSFDTMPTARRGIIPGVLKNLKFYFLHLRISLFTFLKQPYTPGHLVQAATYINSSLCLGVLALPFSRARMEKAGIQREKIIDSYPVVDFKKFYDSSPNGSQIMNMGSAIATGHPTFLRLEQAVNTSQPCFLYSLGIFSCLIGAIMRTGFLSFLFFFSSSFVL